MKSTKELSMPDWFKNDPNKPNKGRDYRSYFSKDQWRRYNAARMMGGKSKIIKEDDDIEI